MAVPPGSRVIRTGRPAFSSREASRRACVDFPQPSEPSNVINRPRAIRASVKHAGPLVESRLNGEALAAASASWLISCLRASARVLNQHEEILARETGTIRLFVGGFCRGRQNLLDRRPELCGPE